MTMTLGNQSRLGTLLFDPMSSYSNSPHFTNPWSSGSASQHNHHGMYSQGGLNANLGTLNLMAKHHPGNRPSPNTSASMAPYGTIPVSSSAAGSTLTADLYKQQDLLNVPQDLLNLNRLQTTSAAYGEPSYATTTPSPVHAPYSASPSSYESVPGYAPAPMRSTYPLAPESDARRYSQSSVSSMSSIDSDHDGLIRTHQNSIVDVDHRSMQQHTDDRRGFADALDASQGMLAMSQETPRAIYPPNSRGRGSADYGFPSTHSTASSISSTSNYGSGYYAASVESSVSDYSTAGSDIESVNSRTLPRPNLLTQPPPAPQSMMGQFSSKLASGTQKKHKCKVCDKRFTRPSSLQTHMYSHTGEKPFVCEVDGCGRHFSVVSNLRRHKKVHKNDTKSEAELDDQPDDHSD